MIWNYIKNKSVTVLKKINALEFQRGVFLRIKRKQLFGSVAVKNNTWRLKKKNLEHIFNSDIIDKKLKILMLTLKWAYLEINCTAEVSFYSYFPLVMINRSYMLILRRRNLILEWIHHVMSLQKTIWFLNERLNLKIDLYSSLIYQIIYFKLKSV